MDLTVVGMISGTSYDAIDAAVGRFALADETIRLTPLGLLSTPLEATLRSRIAAVLPPHPTTSEEVCRLDTELGQRFGAAAAAANVALADGAAELVVSHGQTVFHWVEGDRARGGLQLGAAAWIAEASGLPVVSDVRTRDIARGGQGAPLASTLDALLVLPVEGPRRGSLNLGGIANITVRDAGGRVTAYDLGPAGALVDLAVAEATGGAERMDRDGKRAAAGRVDAGLLARFLEDPYYALPAPKSTGKERFHGNYVRSLTGASPIPLEDLVATLTELTARLVARACGEWSLEELVCAGGGVRNPVLMARIAALARGVRVRSIEEFGLPAQAKEGYLMALLGYLAWHGLEGTIPSATAAWC
ncbi:MAG: anhydro-N-acetylmuramic acid kinase, partial [Solirubrobacteraceae bacterium]